MPFNWFVGIFVMVACTPESWSHSSALSDESWHEISSVATTSPLHLKVLCLICKIKFTLKPYSPLFLFIIVNWLVTKCHWSDIVGILVMASNTSESWVHSSPLSDESSNFFLYQHLSPFMSQNSFWYEKWNLHQNYILYFYLSEICSSLWYWRSQESSVWYVT